MRTGRFITSSDTTQAFIGVSVSVGVGVGVGLDVDASVGVDMDVYADVTCVCLFAPACLRLFRLHLV